MGLYENIREEQVNRLALREPAVVSEDATVPRRGVGNA